MKTKSNVLKIAVIAALSSLAWNASAVTIVKDVSNTVIIPGITGFGTTGADMNGMTIRAVFGDGTDQTLAWGATGPGAGAVSGTDWGITQAGTTFANNSWRFTNNTGSALLDLWIDGSTGLTLLDTTNPSPGTTDSASGKDFAVNFGNSNFITATYSNIVAVSPATAGVRDIFHNLHVDFGTAGVTRNFRFTQDTDNDARFVNVPEPTTLALLGLGLAGFGFSRRKKLG